MLSGLIQKLLGRENLQPLEQRPVNRLDESGIRQRLEELIAQATDATEFGNALANALEHKPEIVGRAINARVVHYQWLSQIGLLLEKFDIDTVIDGGANTGQFATTLFGSALFKGDIHSYEPLEKEFQIMKGYQQHYPRWQIFNAAIGDVEGQTEINISGETSSLLARTAIMDKVAGQETAPATQVVTVKRIDSLYRDLLLDDRKRVMLKLDVQGFEERALRSAGDLLEKFKLVQIELAGMAMYDGDVRIPQCLKLMEDEGFVLIYAKNNYVVQEAVAVDFDFVFCRRSEFEAMQLA